MFIVEEASTSPNAHPRFEYFGEQDELESFTAYLGSLTLEALAQQLITKQEATDFLKLVVSEEAYIWQAGDVDTFTMIADHADSLGSDRADRIIKAAQQARLAAHEMVKELTTLEANQDMGSVEWITAEGLAAYYNDGHVIPATYESSDVFSLEHDQVAVDLATNLKLGSYVHQYEYRKGATPQKSTVTGDYSTHTTLGRNKDGAFEAVVTVLTLDHPLRTGEGLSPDNDELAKIFEPKPVLTLQDILE